MMGISSATSAKTPLVVVPQTLASGTSHLYRVVTVALGLLIVAGVALRIRALGFPASFTFDEELFARNAHNYLLGLRDDNDHPPLGKLLMALGLLLFGYNSLGWRFVSLCFGLQTLLVGYWLGRTLFEQRRAGLFAAAFLAADGFFIAYSRAGLLDGMLTCLVLCSVLAAATARGTLGVLCAALLVGLAASIKWSGALALFPAVAACLLLGRVRKRALLSFAIVPVVHVAIWMFGLRITGQPHDLHSLWKVMVDLFRHHLELGHHLNAAASPWYTWPIMGHPIVVKLSQNGVTNRYASSVGNPLLFLAATSVVLIAFIEMPVLLIYARLRGAMRSISRPAIVLQTGWLALLLPWMVARGSYTFMYHYLPCYGFALVLLAGYAARIERHHARRVLGFTLAALIMSAYFAPVWGELPIGEAAANHRLLFRPWRP